jgi:flagellar hook protein FlgE
MGQVTLSAFPNQQGLRQIGATSWTETFSSGEPATGGPGSASLGKLQSGALEGSNVDITSELVAMIGAQRSFQANAQVISTGDTLTQTVINIRR